MFLNNLNGWILGELYKKHRRLIQPLISVKFSSGNIEFLEKSAELLVSKIKPFVNKGTFDVHDFIHNCCADIMGGKSYFLFFAKI